MAAYGPQDVEAALPWSGKAWRSVKRFQRNIGSRFCQDVSV